MAILEAIAAVATVVLNSALGVVNGLLNLTTYLPSPLKYIFYFAFFLVIIAVLDVSTNAYNSSVGQTIGATFQPCINNDTFRTMFTSLRPGGSSEGGKFEWNTGLSSSYTYRDTLLVGLHPSCYACVVSGYSDASACNLSKNLTVTGLDAYYNSYPLGTYETDSCFYALQQGDVSMVYRFYQMCMSGGNPLAGGLCKDQANTLYGIPRYNYIQQAGFETLMPYTVDFNRTSTTCRGIYLFDTKAWGVIGILSLFIAFAIPYYSWIWNMLAGFLK